MYQATTLIFLSSLPLPLKPSIAIANQSGYYLSESSGWQKQQWYFKVKDGGFFPYRCARTAAATTTDHISNIKHHVKNRHRQNDNYFSTVIVLWWKTSLKSHSFHLFIPSWKCFPALEAKSSLTKHSLSWLPTSCSFNSLTKQEPSVVVFTSHGEQTARPGLGTPLHGGIWPFRMPVIRKYVQHLLVSHAPCPLAHVSFPLLACIGSFQRSHLCWVALEVVLQLAASLLWMEKTWGCSPTASCKGHVRASWLPGIAPATSPPRPFVRHELQLEKQSWLSVPLGFPSHSAKRLSQHKHPSWYHICAKGADWSTGHLVPISKNT